MFLDGIPRQLVCGHLLAFASWLFLKFASAPGPFGDQGDTPMGLMAGSAACHTAHMVPVQMRSTELSATTDGESSTGVDSVFNFLTKCAVRRCPLNAVEAPQWPGSRGIVTC